MAAYHMWGSSGRIILSRLKSSAPGMDGISNFALKSWGPGLAFYILELLEAFCEDLPLPLGINNGVMVFADKMPDERDQGIDSGVVFRHPSETRPVSLKLADNKLVGRGSCGSGAKLLHTSCNKGMRYRYTERVHSWETVV